MSYVTNGVRMLAMLLVGTLLASLVGCAEYGYRMNEMVGFNCRPSALQNGHCVAVKGGSK